HGFDPAHFGVNVKLWEADTGRHLGSLPAADAVHFHGFSPDSRWLYVIGEDGTGVRRLELASLRAGAGAGGPALRSEATSVAPILKASISPDNRVHVCGTDEGGLRLIDFRTGQEVARFPSPAEDRFGPSTFSPVRPSVFSTDGSHLVAQGIDKRALYVFDLYLIRKQLAELGLDWDDVQPLPQRSAVFDPARAAPLRVDLIGAETAGDQAKLAEAELRRAAARLAFHPFDAETHFRLGWCLSVMGQDAAAYASLSAALAFDPALEEALALRAEVARRLGRWGDAVADADRYLAKVPFDHRVRLLRARSNRMRGRYEDAVADYTALRAAWPDEEDICDERADCYDALGRPDLARADRQLSHILGGLGGKGLNDEARRLLIGPVGQRDSGKALELI